jgi:hypothetical protein
MQFGIRTMLGLTTFAAIACAFWPDPNRGPVTAYYLFISLTILLACSFLLTDAAWSRAGKRKAAGGNRRMNPEMVALAMASAGMIPFAALWMFAVVEPYESSGRGIRNLLLGLWYLALGSYVPAALAIPASFIFFGARRNPPLLLLRLIWGCTCVAVPLFIYYLILPRLG